MYLSNLGRALRTRFERTGQLADLDQAITVGREAIDATPAGHPGRPGRLSGLGSTLQTRFERTRAAGGPGPGHHRPPGGCRRHPGRRPRPARPAVQPRERAAGPVRAHRAARRTWTRPSPPARRRSTASPADPDRPGPVQPRERAADPVRAHRAAGGPGPGHHRLPGGRRRHPGRPPRPALGTCPTSARAADPVRAHRAAGGPGPGHHPLPRGRRRHPGRPPRPAPDTCPTSGMRCGPGSGAPGSRRTWTRPSPLSGRRSTPPRPDHPDRPVILSEPRDRAGAPVRAHRAAGGPGPGHHPSPPRPSTPPRPATPTGPDTCPTSGTRCGPGSGAPGSWRTWIRPSPPTRRRSTPPRPTIPSGPGSCPTSGTRCRPGSSAPGSWRTWTRPSPFSGKPSTPPRPTTPTSLDTCPALGVHC